MAFPRLETGNKLPQSVWKNMVELGLLLLGDEEEKDEEQDEEYSEGGG